MEYQVSTLKQGEIWFEKVNKCVLFEFVTVCCNIIQCIFTFQFHFSFEKDILIKFSCYA